MTRQPNRKTKKRQAKAQEESNQEVALSELALFQEWKEHILPELRELLVKGVSAKEIVKKYENYAAARAITIAITETDSSKALSAVKDIIDRASGKAVERKKITHELEELSEEQLNAIGASELFSDEDDESEE